VAPPEQESWKSKGVLRVEMRDAGRGIESYQPVWYDAAAARRHREFDEALQEAGWRVEFGKLRDNILDPGSAAQFRWDHWTSLRGRVTHVYSFSVSAAESHYMIQAGTGGSGTPASAAVAQRGLVFIDRESHRVTRIFAEAITIPPPLGVRNASALLDFDFQIWRVFPRCCRTAR
jgi:hypothetical protein